MKKPIKILHVDSEYKVVYLIIREGSLIRSSVSIEDAITLLKDTVFDLIIYEPDNRAILTPQNTAEGFILTSEAGFDSNEVRQQLGR